MDGRLAGDHRSHKQGTAKGREGTRIGRKTAELTAATAHDHGGVSCFMARYHERDDSNLDPNTNRSDSFVPFPL